MTIGVFPENKNLGTPYENCAFCFKPTPYWTQPDGEGVPICIRCSETRRPDEVPTKEEWFQKDCFTHFVEENPDDD